METYLLDYPTMSFTCFSIKKIKKIAPIHLRNQLVWTTIGISTYYWISKKDKKRSTIKISRKGLHQSIKNTSNTSNKYLTLSLKTQIRRKLLPNEWYLYNFIHLSIKSIFIQWFIKGCLRVVIYCSKTSVRYLEWALDYLSILSLSRVIWSKIW